jgi:hypothetical protein
MERLSASAQASSVQACTDLGRIHTPLPLFRVHIVVFGGRRVPTPPKTVQPCNPCPKIASNPTMSGDRDPKRLQGCRRNRGHTLSCFTGVRHAVDYGRTDD